MAPRRPPRDRLAPEDLALWQKATAAARPLHPEQQPPGAPAAPPPRATAPLRRAETAIPPGPAFRIGAAAPPPKVYAPPPAAVCAPLAMDKRLHARMRRGRVMPEARLDLHGHRLDTAHGALLRFVSNAHARGHRLVLVITGKGRADGAGALRRQVPLWLGQPPLAAMVLQLREAHASHGGAGAFYLYLRRRREG